ncbi:MAG TPA: tetratricopeptide repeat protein, partial [Methanothrix soehngenii]|nr:tetratricopeptide repeat protein [Methanothrix soehngenii]
MDSSSESVVSSLGSFAEMLSDPEGYDPERLKSLSVGVPSLLSSFIEAMLSSDEEVMKRRLTDLEDYASVVNSVQAWFNLGRLAHHLFFHQAAIEYYSNASDLAQILSDDDSLASILLCLGALYGEEEDWARACQCYEKALVAIDMAKRPRLLPQVLERLGRARRLQGEYHQAQICYSRILE